MGVFLLATAEAGVLAVSVYAISHTKLPFPYTPLSPKKIKKIKMEAHLICGLLVLTSLLREIIEWIRSVLLHLCEGVRRRRWRRGCWKNKSRRRRRRRKRRGTAAEWRCLTRMERGRYTCRERTDKHWKRCSGYRKMRGMRRRTRHTGNGAWGSKDGERGTWRWESSSTKSWLGDQLALAV